MNDNKKSALIQLNEKKRSRSNELMHKDNIYRFNPPDFKLLALKYPSFDKYIINKTEKIYNIDWKDSNAVRELTRVILDNDFKLTVEIPDGFLCPTVTLRLNYLLWLNDILLQNKRQNDADNDEIYAIDIGTGACCILPLLACRLFSNWNLFGIDINSDAIEYARKNVKLNNLDDRIKLMLNEQKERENSVIVGIDSQREYQILMCNPPWSTSIEETNLNPNTICTGNSDELIYENGGEIEFIKHLIDQSLLLKNIHIFTSIIGKKSSISPIIKYLKQQSIKNFNTTTLAQGKTFRWAIYWIVDQTPLPITNISETTSTTNNKKLNRSERRKLLKITKSEDQNIVQ
ncbi:hypothetical protein DLAC_01038 [Tieghemostelium lacteum]|uniref:U6 small nuclear RNA (adenine-(43)-N(6))-methyltransferase n=1 Tax=Tieghemostelium lacteum TaxID=361077 RepID=A0A152A7M7_TIELA|nr:hypothetical protein DLAC_01038 [Tieghemostelium lacteum]|eukprot:KYR02218.1 hypothetical protein DLAC_01038 [Tieghemostelium lacteum]